MPSVKKRKFKDDEIAVCVMSFAGDRVRVPEGLRLRGDNEIVQRCPGFFAKDGASAEEITRLRQALIMETEPPAPAAIPEATAVVAEVRDKDALIYIAGIMAGRRVHKDSRAGRTAPAGSVVPVMPDPKLDRHEALEALEKLTVIGDDGQPERVVYGGQLVHRGDPLVELHPTMFVLPRFEPMEVV